ncbi:MAG: hypothetical protein AAB067_04655 [Planctomycetota bacterium]
MQDKLAVIVGIDKENLPESVSCVSGRMFEQAGEVVVGVDMARHFQATARRPV